MELTFRIILFATGIVNFIPALIAFFPTKIKNAYGVAILESDSELLLRHRAILFGIIGGFMLFSALTQKYYVPATVGGLISMSSYIVLFYAVSGTINPELTKVLKIDIVACLLLVIGFAAYLLTK